MFIRFSALLPVAALAAVVAALPGGGLEARYSSGTTTSCSTGENYCCNSTQDPYDPATSLLLGLLGVNIGSVSGLVGITCSPVAGSTSCTQQQACCTGDSFSGGVVIGCSPINVSA